MYYGFDFEYEEFNALCFVKVDDNNEADFLVHRYTISVENNKLKLLDDFTIRDLTDEEETGFEVLSGSVL